jgi:hypothetical protein
VQEIRARPISISCLILGRLFNGCQNADCTAARLIPSVSCLHPIRTCPGLCILSRKVSVTLVMPPKVGTCARTAAEVPCLRVRVSVCVCTYILVCRVLAAATQDEPTATSVSPSRPPPLGASNSCGLAFKSPLAEPESGAQRTRHVCVCDDLAAQKRLSSSDGVVYGITLATAAESVRSCH